MAISGKEPKQVPYVAKDLPPVAKEFHDKITSQFPSGSVIHIATDQKGYRYHVEIWEDHTLLYFVQPDGLTYIAKAFFNGTCNFYGDSEEACDKRAAKVYQGALQYYLEHPPVVN